MIFAALFRRKISECTPIWDIMEGTMQPGLIQSPFRGSRAPLSVSRMCFFLGLKKNLVSIVVLEDCDYNVIFKKGKEVT